MPGRKIIAQGNTVATEHAQRWTWASGETVDLPFVSIHELEGDKVTRWWDYWDLGTLINAAPAGVGRAHHGRLQVATVIDGAALTRAGRCARIGAICATQFGGGAYGVRHVPKSTRSAAQLGGGSTLCAPGSTVRRAGLSGQVPSPQDRSA